MDGVVVLEGGFEVLFIVEEIVPLFKQVPRHLVHEEGISRTHLLHLVTGGLVFFLVVLFLVVHHEIGLSPGVELVVRGNLLQIEKSFLLAIQVIQAASLVEVCGTEVGVQVQTLIVVGERLLVLLDVVELVPLQQQLI